MTVNQILILFKDIASRHKQINDFKVSQDFNIDTEDTPTYSILVVNPISANLPRTENGFTSFVTELDVQLIDIVNKNNENEIEVLSDTIDVLKDVINEFNTHPYYIDNSIDIINTISFESLRGAYDSDVDGWRTQIELETPNKLSYCGSPLENLEGFDFTPAAVTVTDNGDDITLYPSDTYTCMGIMPDGIAYSRVRNTNAITQFRVGDDVYNRINNPYSDPPANPAYIQSLDLTAGVDIWKTLKFNNEFGNKNRFTDPLGGQDFIGQGANIDHLTGVMYRYASFNGTWDDGIDTANGLSFLGYNDWRVCNIFEVMSLWDADGRGQGQNLITDLTESSDPGSSTTRYDSVTTAYRMAAAVGFATRTKTTVQDFIFCRNFY